MFYMEVLEHSTFAISIGVASKFKGLGLGGCCSSGAALTSNISECGLGPMVGRNYTDANRNPYSYSTLHLQAITRVLCMIQHSN
jgi:hypothetical protein